MAAKIKPTHLDWYYLRTNDRSDIFDLILILAKEYRLTLRVVARPQIEKVQNQGLHSARYETLDSYMIDPVAKSARYAQMLCDLPDGPSEWAAHPGLDNPELLTLKPDSNHFRQTDFDLWTSQRAKDIFKEEGIILLDYRAVQAIWNRDG